MKGTPAVPGGLLKSKPACSNASGCSTTPVFFRSVFWFSQWEGKSMSTTGLIILVIVLVLLFGGGGGYYWSRRGR